MHVIAIDGPAGSGKSTVCTDVAKKLGFLFITSGALYRTVGRYFLNVPEAELTKETILGPLPSIQVKITQEGATAHYHLNGDDVTDQLQTPETAVRAALVSKVPQIREMVNHTIRAFAENHHIIIDGRDATTNIFPQATLKLYLDASPEERAARRQKQYLEKGQELSFDEVLADVNRRDHIDMNKGDFSLIKAENVTVIDTDPLSQEEVVSTVLDLYHQTIS